MKTFKRYFSDVQLLQEAPQDLPDNYPQIALPAKSKDLEMLYNLFNHKYFGGELHPCRLKFAALTKRFFGKCHVLWKNWVIQDCLITMATMIQMDRKAICDTLLHEMIHVWQYEQAAKNQDLKYIDWNPMEFFFGTDKHNRGHGKNFQAWMHKLNAIGFDITITGDAPNELDLRDTYYAVIFGDLSADTIILFSSQDFRHQFEDMMQSIINRAGASEAYSNFTYLQTQDAAVLMTTRLTKQGVLPKNVYNIFYRAEFAEQLIKSPHTKIIHEGKIKSVQDEQKANDKVPAEIIQFLQRFHKYRGTSWGNYLYNVWINNKSYFPDDLKPSRLSLSKPGEPLEGIDHKLIEYIYQDWKNISDRELSSSQDVSSLVTDIRFAGVKDKDNPINADVLRKIREKYEHEWKIRVSPERFMEALRVEWVKETKKFAKKYGRGLLSDSDIELAAKAIFKVKL